MVSLAAGRDDVCNNSGERRHWIGLEKWQWGWRELDRFKKNRRLNQ